MVGYYRLLVAPISMQMGDHVRMDRNHMVRLWSLGRKAASIRFGFCSDFLSVVLLMAGYRGTPFAIGLGRAGHSVLAALHVAVISHRVCVSLSCCRHASGS